MADSGVNQQSANHTTLPLAPFLVFHSFSCVMFVDSFALFTSFVVSFLPPSCTHQLLCRFFSNLVTLLPCAAGEREIGFLLSVLSFGDGLVEPAVLMKILRKRSRKGRSSSQVVSKLVCVDTNQDA